MRKTIASMLLLGFLSACGDDGPAAYRNDVTIEPTLTRGAVVGRLEDLSGAPIVGASAWVLTGKEVRSATTDDEGRFFLGELPGGSELEVRIEAEGYLPARVSARIPNEAGETPVDGGVDVVGPVVLLQSDGRLAFEFVGMDGARLEPPSGTCSVQVSWVRYEVSNRLGEGPLTVSARSEGGSMICEGLPDLGALAQLDETIEYRFAAVDVDGDGVADYAGVTGSVRVRDFLTSGDRAVWIQPARLDDGFGLVATNVPELRGEEVHKRTVPTDAGVEVVFSRPAAVLEATVRSLFGGERLAFEVREEGNRVRLVPEGGTWPPGQLYELVLVVAPRGAPFEAVTYYGTFWTSSSELPRASARFVDGNSNGRLDAGETLVVEFSEYIFCLDGPVIPLLVDADVDGSGTVGDAPGEYGQLEPLGLWAGPADVYGNLAIRFSRTWDSSSIAAGVDVSIPFDLLPLWGSAQRFVVTEAIEARLEAASP